MLHRHVAFQIHQVWHHGTTQACPMRPHQNTTLTKYPFNRRTGGRDGEYLCCNVKEGREFGLVLLPKLEAWDWGRVLFSNQVEVCSQLSLHRWLLSRRESSYSGKTILAAFQEESLSRHFPLVQSLHPLSVALACHPLPLCTLTWKGQETNYKYVTEYT